MDLALLLVFSTPLALAAMGELVGQRSGVINIGLEGMMLIAAFIGVYVAKSTGSIPLAFLVPAAAGAVLGLLSGFFTVELGADQVVVGTAINFLALGATGLAFRSTYGTSGQLLDVTAMTKFGGIDGMVVLMLALIPVVGFAIYRTNWGLVLRASGDYPKAVEVAGFSVARVRLQAVAIGGAFAGLAGAYLSLGVANSFAEGMTAGRGFVAIALVTFGRWRPLYVTLAALLIGYCQSLKFSLQESGVPGYVIVALLVMSAFAVLAVVLARRVHSRNSAWILLFGGLAIVAALNLPKTVAVPSQLWLALPYVVALIVLIFVGKGTVAPGALGIAYKRER